MTPLLQYKDRGHNRTLLMVPGWGFDAHIFASLSLPYNYLWYTSCDMAGLEAAVLAGGYGALDMLGWSQGGVALAGLAVKHPDLVSQLILVGVRPAYPAEGLVEIRGLLTRNRRTYLKCFYKACLGRADLSWFKQTLQRAYLEKFTLDDLTSGLDWLAQVQLDVAALQSMASVTLVHGSQDQVAPVHEVRALAAQLPRARYCEVPEAAHAAFLQPGFAECVSLGRTGRQEGKKRGGQAPRILRIQNSKLERSDRVT